MMKRKVLAISGSTRKGSSNEAILNAIAAMYANELEVQLYTRIDELPHFNPDHDNESVDGKVKEFRLLVDQADGVIICTPEYVFSLPGSLKNALEWTVSTVVFTDKPFAFIIASASGEKAFESLDLIMTTLQAKIGANSRLLIKAPKGKVDKHTGVLNDPQTLDQLRQLVASFKESMTMN